MRVFLTGGTGLLGSHLAGELRALGHEVVALHRPGSDARFLGELGCDLAEGDVRDDADALAPLMEGCSHVVHSAAIVYGSGEWREVGAVNVAGTRNVLSAAAQARVGHALHVSSVAVYGAVAGAIDESSPTDSQLAPGDLYARSKREAEAVARGIEADRGLPVTVVRPAAVYGERDRLMAPALARLLRLPLVPLLGPGSHPLPVVYAGNVARALRLALQAARGRATYDIGLDRALTQRQLFEGLADGMGLSPRLFRLPAGAVRAVGDLLGRMHVRAPGARHLSLSRVTRLALTENPYPSRRIRAELGWDPTHSHAEALRRTGRWLVRGDRADRPEMEPEPA